MIRTAAVIGLLCAGAARAAEPSADEALLKKVSDKLVAACEAPDGFEWPPEFRIVNKPGVNASAGADQRDGKRHPFVVVHDDMMTKVIEGDEHRLALVVGHEICHITRRHVLAQPKRDRTEFLRVTYWRDEEIEADQAGAELMLKAGFDLKKGMSYITRINGLGLSYSSLEGLGSDHPSWNDRIARLDKGRERLWKSMAAFQDGVTLLETEQYPLAEVCFERVVKEFPESHEAWVNLGNARLMRYFDGFEPDDVKAYGVAMVLTPGFYLRPGSITTRGVDAKLWKEAVAALEKSLELKKGQALARSNLGLAYLFHPDGKDVKKALVLMQAAADDAVLDDDVVPFHYATILINLAAARLAGGEQDRALAYALRALEVARVRKPGGTVVTHPVLQAAFDGLVARVAAASPDAEDRRGALTAYERFLKGTGPSSAWWDAAYDEYKELAAKLKAEAKAKDAFRSDVEATRPPLAHKFKGGEVRLGEGLAEVVKRLGAGLQTSATTGGGLKRVRYGKEGVELLANESVVAICLVSADAGRVVLRGRGTSGAVALNLVVGMPAEEVIQVLGPGEKRMLTDPSSEYVYYRGQALGVRFSRGKVAEIVLAFLPAQRKN
jgi:tetratricopeptide (TPR) repeat protein